MTVSDLEHFRNLLEERRHTILEWMDTGTPAADRDLEHAQALLSQIKEALGRIDTETFGHCVVCQGEVELHRLEVQPVNQVCLSCITKQEQAQLENDLFLASKIHRALLPQAISPIEGFEVAVRSQAARFVGGDYFDFLPGGDRGAVRIVIGDVMGKGISAGLMMSNIQGALRILAEGITSPSRLIAQLNHWLCRNIPVTKFVSLVCVAVEPQNGQNARLTYTNAGHCPPLLVRANGTVESLEPTGGVLGVHEDFKYEECVREVQPDDLLMLYTDGITEVENQAGDMFDEHRLSKFVCENRMHPLDTMFDKLWVELKNFGTLNDPSDDQTVVALRRRAVAKS